MKQLAMTYFTETSGTLLALLLFFGSFMALILVVFFVVPPSKYDKLRALPLDREEDTNG